MQILKQRKRLCMIVFVFVFVLGSKDLGFMYLEF